MTSETASLRPPSKALLFLEFRALPELAGYMAALPFLTTMAPRGDGHPVMVLPGFLTSDRSTRPIRSYLSAQGYDAHGWGLGRNLGLLPGVEQGMVDQVRRLADKAGRKVSLVGWSLGGVYARQLAKYFKDEVRSVVTLGSPFAGDPKATNAWRLYEFTSGHKVDDRDRHMGGAIHEPPPVPTTAIYSRTDGICAWQCCVEKDGHQVESIEVEGSHCGLGHHPAVLFAVADRLAQPEGAWKPFERNGMRGFFYPQPRRDN